MHLVQLFTSLLIFSEQNLLAYVSVYSRTHLAIIYALSDSASSVVPDRLVEVLNFKTLYSQ